MKRFTMLLITVPVMAAAVLAATGAAGAAGGSLPKVTITTDGKSINVGGTLQSGGVNVVTKVTGEPQANPILVRLNPGVTPKRLISFLHTKGARDANNIAKFGSITFDAQVPKGTTSVQTTLNPARYVAIDAGRGPNKAPSTSFTVSKSSAPAKLPKPDATVKTIEFSFRGATKLKAGSLVRFKDAGFLAHMDIALPTSRSNAQKLVRSLRTGNGNPRKLVTGEPQTWLGTVSPGAFQQMKLDAKPGVYVMACFEDTQDGREHTRLGMERIVHVVK